jgi:hypothetical protein
VGKLSANEASPFGLALLTIRGFQPSRAVIYKPLFPPSDWIITDLGGLHIAQGYNRLFCDRDIVGRRVQPKHFSYVFFDQSAALLCPIMSGAMYFPHKRVFRLKDNK